MRKGKWGLPARAVRLALLGLVLALLIWTAELALALFPVSLVVAGAETTVAVEVDGQTHRISPARPPTGLRFVPLSVYRREYQVDGSDTTNNFTFVAAYFADFAKSPYYRVQAFLRDESSYSRWEDLILTGPSGLVIGRESRPPDGALVALPRAFRLSVELHRIETPRSLEFLEEGGGRFQIELNRNDRYVRVTEMLGGGSTRELGHWFFPTDWRPPLAEVLALWLRVAALAIALVVLLVPLVPLFPRRPIRIADRHILAAPALLALVALLLGVAFSAGVFDRAPHVLDAVSYYFQAKVFASGALAAPAPPLKDAFPTAFTVVHQGRWFSQYPPATAGVLALGLLAQLPWLVEPLLAGAAVLLTFGVARRQFGIKTGLLTAGLMATSPFLALQAGSFLSHVPAMFAAVLCIYAATRYLERPALRWALLAAGALGLVFLSREIAAVLIGVPVGSMIAYRAWRSPPPHWVRDLAAAAGCLLIAVLGYGLYNMALTGSAFELPRHLFNPADHLGFGPGIGFYGRHTLAAGLVNADELLTSLNISLFGWPFGMGLAVITLPFMLERPGSWVILHGSIVATFIVAHIAYFYHGIALGPRYYFEALPSMVILASRGFVVLAVAASSLAESLGIPGGRDRGEKAALALVVALLACNLVYFLPRQAELYRGYSGMPGRDGPRMTGFIRYDLPGREPTLTNALITTTDWWAYEVDLAPLNCPRLDCPSVFALASSPATAEALSRAFPARRTYMLQERGGRLTVVPQGGG